jgi:N,N'-diacetyllegionaminate synthase
MSKVTIIAEAGVNHNGDLQLARQLIDIASNAGADYVKFQTFKVDSLVRKDAEMASYQKQNTSSSGTQRNLLKKLELTEAMHEELIGYAATRSIKFLSTAFDIESMQFLRKLGVDTGKIPSGEITNLPYLRAAAGLFEHIILSTGMATLAETGEAIDALVKSGSTKDSITVLHCTTEYPTPYEDVNLRAMDMMKNEFGTRVGYSDHTSGIEVAIAAVALGASIIEKHFTIDRNLEGPDHKASIEPGELQQMVRSIRNIENSLGKAEKAPSPAEIKNIPLVRKSIVASKVIREGEAFTIDNITTKRPGNGLSPMLWDSVIGKHATKNFEVDDYIEV